MEVVEIVALVFVTFSSGFLVGCLTAIYVFTGGSGDN